MTLPLDVVIPTNQPEKGSIVLKAGQKVLVLKSPKGVYMQLESGKIVAIKTAIKVRGKAEEDAAKAKPTSIPPAIKNNSALSVLPQRRPMKPFTPGATKFNVRSVKQAVPNLVSRIQSVSKKMNLSKAKPYQIGSEIARAVSQAKSDDSQPLSSDEDSLPPESIRSELPVSVQKKNEKAAASKEPLRAEVAPQSSKGFRAGLAKTGGSGSGSGSSQTTALEQLEQSTSSVPESKQPFQVSMEVSIVPI